MQSRVWFEVRHMIAAPFTLAMLAWFAVYAAIDKVLPRKLVVFLAFITGFVVADALYNWTVGTFLFLERPREWLFTTRLQRLYDHDVTATQRFVAVLNALDPQHVRTEI